MIEFVHIAHAATEAAVEHAATDGGGVLGSLGLNAKLFLAQLVNFAIVLFVLWKWVLPPLAKRLQERSLRIESSLNNARAIEEEKKQFEQWRKEEMQKARVEASGIVTQSHEDAVKLKDEIITQAKQDQEAIVQRGREQIEAEKNKILSEIKSEVADLVVSTVGQILPSKLNADVDRAYVEDILKKTEAHK